MLTSLLHAKRGDVPFSREDMVQTLMLFFQAGLDTVTGTLGFFMEFLATHPAHRQLLIEEPNLIPNAIEELMRYFSIVTVDPQGDENGRSGGGHDSAKATFASSSPSQLDETSCSTKTRMRSTSVAARFATWVSGADRTDVSGRISPEWS